jgi:chain length determinant protein (polysaccharide antigen chain regulator)
MHHHGTFRTLMQDTDCHRIKMNNMNHANDEISLIDLMRIFWQQRVIILISVFVCFSISVGYLFYAKPKYEASASIEAPKSLNLSRLNVAAFHNPDESLLKKYTVTDVYTIFAKNLLSQSVKEKFFNEVYLPYLTHTTEIKSTQAAYTAFLKELKIKPDPIEKTNYKIYLASYSMQKSEEFLRKYLQMAQEVSTYDLKKDLNVQLKTKLLSLKSEIQFIQDLSKKYNTDALISLQNALVEAKAENIENFLASHINNNNNNTNSNNSNNNSDFDAFMLGTKILTSRIKNLEQSGISPFLLSKYRDLEADYNFYSKTENLLLKVNFYQLDGSLRASEFPLSPKPNLILSLGVALGFILGCVIAIVITSLQKKLHKNLDVRSLIFKRG